ncbi:MAG: SDR family NAD(P)-dependent oxidoreductase [Gluconobacter japonicus]
MDLSSMTSTPPNRPGLQSRILITGASSGIGEALALHYARAGTHLVLWGRNQTRLDRVAAQAAKHGATTETLALDLCDPEAALEALRKADDTTPVDILILAAGLGDIRPEGELTELPEQVKTISLVNFTTPVTLATEMARRMVTRGGGNIALIGSVAAFHDLPIATAYSGSKAGLARFSTALHAAMTPHNVHITLVSPGYVDTPMSQRLEGARPFLVSSRKAARIIARAIGQGRAHLLFPWPFALARLLEMLVPRPIAHRLLRSAEVRQSASN